MADSKKVDCKYGEKCYQKNPEHHQKYNHPWKKNAKLDVPHNTQKRSPSPREESENESKRQKKPRKSPSPNLQTEKRRSKSRSKSPQRTGRSRSRSPQKRGKSPSPAPASPRKRNSVSPQPGSSDGKTKELLKVDEAKEKSPSPRHLGKRQSKSPSQGRSTDDEEESKDSSGNQEKLREMAERKEMDITKEYEEVMRNLSKSNYFEVFQRRVRYSKKAEYQDLLKTREFIRHKFLVEMPPDFFKFWQFCESIAKTGQKPEAVFEKVGLKLVGPFDYLAGKFHEVEVREPGDYLRHWRFYYDPAEFQTIFVMNGTEVHYGYWRDDPKDSKDLLVARNDSKKGFEFDFIGGNCFEAALYFLEKDAVFTPFNRGEINGMKKRIQKFAEDNDIPLDSLGKLQKARNAKVVCKTFHKAGIVVPLDRKTKVGYRNLIESDANLKKILSKIGHALGDKTVISNAMEELQSIITAANIAVDECDFGTAVELGIDLFCSGSPELHQVINQLLVTGYSMLRRPQFIAIMKAHLENRKRGNDLDMLK